MMESKERYKKWHLLGLQANVVSGILNIVLIAIIVFMAISEKEPGVVAVTKDFRAIPLPVLSQPVVQDSGLIQFAYVAVPKMLSLDFDNPQRTIDNSIEYFSSGAYRSYQFELDEKGWLTAAKNKQLLIRCVVSSTPRIVNRYIQDGRATWEMQIPILVTVESTNDVLSRNNWTVNLKIQRCSLAKRDSGIWISLFQIL